ncbi:CBU_0592 family membrane protein [Dactylosporangium sp. CS-033363]|uniref:CBU_0592 family membrane protein n=1 Tax=Dactylosporangium sp. CS-033363 TaxID=3239935 RepID=UPI003D8F5B7E
MLIDFMGWIGAALVLAAYALVSTKRLAGDGVVFQTMNIVGAIALAWNSAVSHAWPSVAVNVAWVGIGAIAMYRIARRARTTEAQREYQGARIR